MLAVALAARLEFLSRVTEKECGHLLDTDARLFAIPFTVEEARRITADPVPAETSGPAMENLDKAEKFGRIESADS